MKKLIVLILALPLYVLGASWGEDWTPPGLKKKPEKAKAWKQKHKEKETKKAAAAEEEFPYGTKWGQFKKLPVSEQKRLILNNKDVEIPKGILQQLDEEVQETYRNRAPQAIG